MTKKWLKTCQNKILQFQESRVEGLVPWPVEIQTASRPFWIGAHHLSLLVATGYKEQALKQHLVYMQCRYTMWLMWTMKNNSQWLHVVNLYVARKNKVGYFHSTKLREHNSADIPGKVSTNSVWNSSISANFRTFQDKGNWSNRTEQSFSSLLLEIWIQLLLKVDLRRRLCYKYQY